MWRIGIECKMQRVWGSSLSIWRLRMHATYNFTYVRKFHKMWNIGMKYMYVTYWYQFFTRCEELVPIFPQFEISEMWNLRFNIALSFSRGSWPVLLKKNPYIFVIFQRGGPDRLSPSGSAHERKIVNIVLSTSCYIFFGCAKTSSGLFKEFLDCCHGGHLGY